MFNTVRDFNEQRDNLRDKEFCGVEVGGLNLVGLDGGGFCGLNGGGFCIS